MIPTNFEAIFSIFRFFLMASKMAIFRGFGPRHAAGLAERPFFIFDIIFYHPKEHSLRVLALNSKMTATVRVVMEEPVRADYKGLETLGAVQLPSRRWQSLPLHLLAVAGGCSDFISSDLF